MIMIMIKIIMIMIMKMFRLNRKLSTNLQFFEKLKGDVVKKENMIMLIMCLKPRIMIMIMFKLNKVAQAFSL